MYSGLFTVFGDINGDFVTYSDQIETSGATGVFSFQFVIVVRLCCSLCCRQWTNPCDHCSLFAAVFD